MTPLTKMGTYKSVAMLLLLCLFQTMVWAQEESGSSTTTTKTTNVRVSDAGNTWYAQPWVWVVGGAVLILLLVALLRGNRSSSGSTDRVTVTKTVERDTDI